jgi:hypothetical protein
MRGFDIFTRTWVATFVARRQQPGDLLMSYAMPLRNRRDDLQQRALPRSDLARPPTGDWVILPIRSGGGVPLSPGEVIAKCRLWVIRRHRRPCRQCPLYPDKQTSTIAVVGSALRHKQTCLEHSPLPPLVEDLSHFPIGRVERVLRTHFTGRGLSKHLRDEAGRRRPGRCLR